MNFLGLSGVVKSKLLHEDKVKIEIEEYESKELIEVFATGDIARQITISIKNNDKVEVEGELRRGKITYVEIYKLIPLIAPSQVIERG